MSACLHACSHIACIRTPHPTAQPFGLPACPPAAMCSTPPEQRSNGTQLMEEFMRRQQQGGSGATTPGAEVRWGTGGAGTDWLSGGLCGVLVCLLLCVYTQDSLHSNR